MALEMLNRVTALRTHPGPTRATIRENVRETPAKQVAHRATQFVSWLFDAGADATSSRRLPDLLSTSLWRFETLIVMNRKKLLKNTFLTNRFRLYCDNL